VDCATNRTIDPANAAAHSWRANLFNVSKYRKVAVPNTDNFAAYGQGGKVRKSGRNLRYQSMNIASGGVHKTNHLEKDSYRMRNIERLYQPMMTLESHQQNSVESIPENQSRE